MGLAADRCGALRLRPVQTRQSVTVDLPIETSGLECQMFEPKLGAVFMPLGDAAWDVNHRKHVTFEHIAFLRELLPGGCEEVRNRATHVSILDRTNHESFHENDLGLDRDFRRSEKSAPKNVKRGASRRPTNTARTFEVGARALAWLNDS